MKLTLSFQDWQNIQFIHIFQEQLLTGRRSAGEADVDGLQAASIEAVVDLQHVSVFQEHFFLAVIEKMDGGVVGGGGGASVLHMWRIVISSHGNRSILSHLPSPSLSSLWSVTCHSMMNLEEKSSFSVSQLYSYDTHTLFNNNQLITVRGRFTMCSCRPQRYRVTRYALVQFIMHSCSLEFSHNNHHAHL